VKFLPSGVVHSAANGIAEFISRIPIGITVLPTRVRAESSGRDDISKLYVVFNIRRNRFRLITVIHYAKTIDEKRTEGHVYIRSFLTHKEYNDRRKWDRRFGAK
jgi:hypothetical protein